MVLGKVEKKGEIQFTFTPPPPDLDFDAKEVPRFCLRDAFLKKMYYFL